MVSNVNELASRVDQASGGRQPTEAASPRELLQRLPPSGRDFDVFEHVVVDGGTTRSAAQEFKIPQTRVCQVLERVRAWVDEVTLAAADEQVSQKQLQLAEGLAADRLDRLYGQALVGWRSSSGEVERIRVSAVGERVTTCTISHGDPRYLSIAARIALLRSRVASLGALNQRWLRPRMWKKVLFPRIRPTEATTWMGPVQEIRHAECDMRNRGRKPLT